MTAAATIGSFHPSRRGYRFTVLLFVGLLTYGSYFGYDVVGALAPTLMGAWHTISDSDPAPKMNRPTIATVRLGANATIAAPATTTAARMMAVSRVPSRSESSPPNATVRMAATL